MQFRPQSRIRWSTVLGLCLAVITASRAQSAEPAADSDQEFDRLITTLVRTNIPHAFEEEDDWGETTRRWDGLHMSFDGLRLDTKRRWKEVNHGDWKRYQCRLLDPQREFRIEFKNLRRDADGRTVFDVDTHARLQLSGRYSKWVKGVQLLSLSVDSTARVQLRLTLAVDSHLTLEHLPPDLQLEAEVLDAKIDLIDFDLDRISKLRGDAAERLGRNLRRVLESKIDDKQQKLIDKLNREIDEHHDDLRLSLHDLLD